MKMTIRLRAPREPSITPGAVRPRVSDELKLWLAEQRDKRERERKDEVDQIVGRPRYDKVNPNYMPPSPATPSRATRTAPKAQGRERTRKET